MSSTAVPDSQAWISTITTLVSVGLGGLIGVAASWLAHRWHSRSAFADELRRAYATWLGASFDCVVQNSTYASAAQASARSMADAARHLAACRQAQAIAGKALFSLQMLEADPEAIRRLEALAKTIDHTHVNVAGSVREILENALQAEKSITAMADWIRNHHPLLKVRSAK